MAPGSSLALYYSQSSKQNREVSFQYSSESPVDTLQILWHLSRQCIYNVLGVGKVFPEMRPTYTASSSLLPQERSSFIPGSCCSPIPGTVS